MDNNAWKKLLSEAREAICKHGGPCSESETSPLNEVNWPEDVERYYKKCRDKQKGKSEEYCARVAWSIYCAHKNPQYPGCTKFGKSWGPPYSKPLSAAKESHDCGCNQSQTLSEDSQARIARILHG